MRTSKLLKLAMTSLAGLISVGVPASAATQLVSFTSLVESASLPTPLRGGDTLILDTVVTTATGPLQQTINFVLGAGVDGVESFAAWQISTPTSLGPRLVAVNIKVLDDADNQVYTDTSTGVAGGFLTSGFAGAIGPGAYKVVVTGVGVRDSSLDLSLSFTGVVPEPGSYALMLGGLAAVGLSVRRRKPA